MNDPPSSSRRDFLSGRAALSALRNAAPEIEEEPQPTAYLMHAGRRAMAAEFQVYFNAEENDDATEAVMAGLDQIEALERQMTIYQSSSEISRLNQQAAEQPVKVEAQLFALLELAARIYEHTGGAFDITSGPLSQVWGFSRRQGRFPQAEELQEALDRVGGRWLEFDRQQQTIRFQKPGLEINLGGIGKGYALDRCSEILRTWGVENFLIHGGLSSVLAYGNRAETGPEPGWRVGVLHPLREERRLTEIRLHNRAMGTSGSGKQFFYHQGRRYGHVLDPRNGQPAEGVLSATVLAPTAAEADALATAFYVMGAEASLHYCREHPEISTLIATPARRAGEVEIHTANW